MQGHGTYRSPGELHAIARVIQEAGLERARARPFEGLREQEQRSVGGAQVPRPSRPGTDGAVVDVDAWCITIGEA